MKPKNGPPIQCFGQPSAVTRPTALRASPPARGACRRSSPPGRRPFRRDRGTRLRPSPPRPSPACPFTVTSPPIATTSPVTTWPSRIDDVGAEAHHHVARLVGGKLGQQRASRRIGAAGAEGAGHGRGGRVTPGRARTLERRDTLGRHQSGTAWFLRPAPPARTPSRTPPPPASTCHQSSHDHWLRPTR